MKKIILVFICRDNAGTIGRMIDSCLPIIDGIAATDTGSKDNTLEIISSYNDRVKVSIFEEPWLNFAHNRTIMMRNAGVFSEADYYLIMDTDETLEIAQDFNKGALDLNSYMIRTFSGDMYYYRQRLVGVKFPWVWKGFAHEYMITPEGVGHSGRLNNLTMVVHPKQERNSNNIIRNYKLLIKDLEQDPQNARTVFYLGESCRDLRWLEDAIYYYTLRSKMGGFAEEVYYAILQLGIVNKWKGFIEEAKNCFYQAIEKRPKRVEAMYELAIIHKEQNRHDLAIMYLERIINMPDTDDMLFINLNIKKYLAKFHLSISLYYTGEYQKSLKHAQELIAMDIPENIKQQNFKNIAYTRRMINERFPEEKTLVISVPWAWDGLGDTLFMSHIPKIAKEKAGFKYVYINRAHAFKSPGTQELVWGINPYVDGFTDEQDLYFEEQQWVHWTLCGLGDIQPARNKFPNNAMLHRLMKIYKLDDADFDGLPYVNWYNIQEKCYDSKLDITLIRKSVIFDGNWKAHIGIEEQDVQKFFLENRKPDFQFAPVNHPKSEVGGAESKCILIPDVPQIKVQDIFEYAYVLAECKLFIGLMSGGAVLSAALHKPCVVLDSKKTTQMHRFDEFNWHIYLDKEERTYDQVRSLVNNKHIPKQKQQTLVPWPIDQLVSQNSLLSSVRLNRLAELLISVEHLPGSVMEIGCYKGGASRYMAQHTKEWVYMIDTFNGLPDQSKEDNYHVQGEFKANLDDVANSMYGLKNYYVVRGTHPEEISKDLPNAFKFVHLDVDLYQGTAEYLKWLKDRMVFGGIIVIDDYKSNHCMGVTKAVDEFLEENGLKIQVGPEVQAHIVF